MNNISLSFFSQNFISFIKENIFSTLTPLQLKVVKISSIAIGLFVAGFVLGRCKLDCKIFHIQNYRKVTKTEPDGTRCIGNFINGKLDGEGEKIKPNGTIHKGIFKDGELVDGKVTCDNGIEREGKFNNEMLDGRGKVKFPNGTTLEGLFNNSKFVNGTKTTSNGSIYEGQFEDCELYGRGKKKTGDGVEYEGEFKRDRLNGEGIKTELNGTIWDGNFVDDIFRGRGRKIESDKTEYIGKFKLEERIVGHGIKILPDRTQIEGNFNNNGMLHGICKVSYPNGKAEDRRFENDVMMQN